jgi:hypothetical protein
LNDDYKSKIMKPGAISIGVTWVEGRVIFKNPDKKWAKFYYGICSYHNPYNKKDVPSVFAVTPMDYLPPTMITTIEVVPYSNWCERANTCLNFTCTLNNFNRKSFEDEFKDCKSLTLGLPQNLGDDPIWFSVGKFKMFWTSFVIPVEGGTINYKEE